MKQILLSDQFLRQDRHRFQSEPVALLPLNKAKGRELITFGEPPSPEEDEFGQVTIIEPSIERKVGYSSRWVPSNLIGSALFGGNFVC